MRSKIALFIAAVGLISLLPSLLIAIQSTGTTYRWQYMPLEWSAWVAIGQAFVAPIGLFAMAAVVEMLFRISERLPLAPAADAATGRRPVLGWQSTIAKGFLAVALVLYLAILVAALVQMQTWDTLAETFPEERRWQVAVGIVINWATFPLEFVAWAAVVEYLSRIAAALSARVAGEVAP